MQKGKWLSEEALQTAEKKEEKQKAKKKMKDLNAEFQRIAKRDKKPLLTEQCKEIEEKSRMGKTRDLVKKSSLYLKHELLRPGILSTTLPPQQPCCKDHWSNLV